MAITIIPASHEPKPHPLLEPVSSTLELLQHSCPDAYFQNETRVVASSFAAHYGVNAGIPPDIYPSSSSFIRSAVEAWGRHSHLVIRPEDIWFTILVQMNFYMEAHASDLRHLFVAHEDKKPIHVESNSWPEVLDEFREELHKRIKTDWMADWVSPGFSTSTPDDETTATVLMMGLMKAYFEYSGGIICGIPSVTLLGTKADWQRLLEKAERLREFGKWPGLRTNPARKEPGDYYNRLRPILTRIVKSFDNPHDPETRDFWNNIVQAKVMHSCLCGAPPTQYMVSGWIMGFYYWKSTGEVSRSFTWDGRKWDENYHGPDAPVTYDGVRYGIAALEDIPIGYAKANFTMTNEHGGPENEFKGWVLAGNIGKKIVDGAPDGYLAALREVDGKLGAGVCENESKPTSGLCGKHDNGLQELLVGDKEAGLSPAGTNAERIGSTIQPLSGWFLFGPEKDARLFHSGEEVSGPTADALKSCGGIEHYGHDGFRAYGPSQ